MLDATPRDPVEPTQKVSVIVRALQIALDPFVACIPLLHSD
jgi:hypothetical protein